MPTHVPDQSRQPRWPPLPGGRLRRRWHRLMATLVPDQPRRPRRPPLPGGRSQSRRHPLMATPLGQMRWWLQQRAATPRRRPRRYPRRGGRLTGGQIPVQLQGVQHTTLVMKHRLPIRCSPGRRPRWSRLPGGQARPPLGGPLLRLLPASRFAPCCYRCTTRCLPGTRLTLTTTTTTAMNRMSAATMGVNTRRRTLMPALLVRASSLPRHYLPYSPWSPSSRTVSCRHRKE